MLQPIGRDVSIAIYTLCEVENALSNRRKKDGGDALITSEEQAMAGGCAASIEAVSKQLWLEQTIMAALQIHHHIVSKSATLSDISTRLQTLRETILRDLFRPLYLPASKDMLEFLDKKHPFGEPAAKGFSECTEDIDEAHKCFAFERYTACVFHLGRAMERATHKLCKKVTGKTPSKDDWQGYLFKIEAVINAMPHKPKSASDKRSHYMEARAFSMDFKEAWRNKTAHPKQTYTRSEALEIMSATRAFMNAVATKIFKVKTT